MPPNVPDPILSLKAFPADTLEGISLTPSLSAINETLLDKIVKSSVSVCAEKFLVYFPSDCFV